MYPEVCTSRGIHGTVVSCPWPVIIGFVSSSVLLISLSSSFRVLFPFSVLFAIYTRAFCFFGGGVNNEGLLGGVIDWCGALY